MHLAVRRDRIDPAAGARARLQTDASGGTRRPLRTRRRQRHPRRQIRIIADKENLLPVRMTVVNKTGGNGATAMAYLAERKGESHVIALYTAAWLTAPLMSKEARVMFNDLTPIANLLSEPVVIVVKGDSPSKRWPTSSTPRRRRPTSCSVGPPEHPQRERRARASGIAKDVAEYWERVRAAGENRGVAQVRRRQPSRRALRQER